MEIGDQWSLSSDSYHSRFSESRKLFCGYFPSCIRHSWDRHTQQLTESIQWFPDLWSKGCYGGKVQVEATRTAT